MKQVRNTVGRWVQQVVSKSRVATNVQPARQPQVLDARLLSKVTGGTSDSADQPNKGW